MTNTNKYVEMVDLFEDKKQKKNQQKYQMKLNQKKFNYFLKINVRRGRESNKKSK